MKIEYFKMITKNRDFVGILETFLTAGNFFFLTLPGRRAYSEINCRRLVKTNTELINIVESQFFEPPWVEQNLFELLGGLKNRG